MTPAAFRKLALALDGTTESSHMGHPDFRAGGRIFATLGAPDDTCAMVRLLPDQQRAMLAAAPEVFFPASGQWGRAGCTHLRLKPATTGLVRPVLELAHAAALAAAPARKPAARQKPPGSRRSKIRRPKE